jgi:RimJ/RimL family protein N-acetyltransferase
VTIADWPTAEPLTTGRLDLEPLRVEHAREMQPVLDDPALYVHTGGEPPSVTALAERYERQVRGHSPDGSRGWLNWVLRLRAGGVPAGLIQATLGPGGAELAWIVGSAHQGTGLATEAATAVAAWLRAQGIGELSAHIRADNTPSEGVARHIGMSPTAEIKDGERRWTT